MKTIAKMQRDHHLTMVTHLVFSINRLGTILHDLEKELKKEKRLLKKANRCIA